MADEQTRQANAILEKIKLDSVESDFPDSRDTDSLEYEKVTDVEPEQSAKELRALGMDKVSSKLRERINERDWGEEEEVELDPSDGWDFVVESKTVPADPSKPGRTHRSRVPPRTSPGYSRASSPTCHRGTLVLTQSCKPRYLPRSSSRRKLPLTVSCRKRGSWIR